MSVYSEEEIHHQQVSQREIQEPSIGDEEVSAKDFEMQENEQVKTDEKLPSAAPQEESRRNSNILLFEEALQELAD